MPGACDSTGAGSGLATSGGVANADAVANIRATIADASWGSNFGYVAIGRAGLIDRLQPIPRPTIADPSRPLPSPGYSAASDVPGRNCSARSGARPTLSGSPAFAESQRQLASLSCARINRLPYSEYAKPSA